ncbi:thin aggregative fimbriae synthesis protein [Hafnia paralvei ATCC 29927]|uniref:curli assembly chaperone CsgC n=1 Tax=Hafnia paralvei TaxID=546367 RepID=UPI0007E47F5A|nr:curli assembly chaperone CsgC [Hafnia paralvei]MDU1191217.1 curli assembly chaperone CsgC [Enterobacteriaceae bacterium]MDU1244155.1 curli assembly chaperone CsgC [Enterobacteriaceae bacterium]OAT42073.1 thin aggregative fimbriae synthesis protein [Hafnia paralvei ATCC 29927]HCU15358.1 aggregative fimbriae synthesis protein [Hafnia paralvei]
MHPLLIASVLSNQLWFDTTQEGQYYILKPMASITNSCVCNITVDIIRHGLHGESISQQTGTVQLTANRKHALGQMSFSVLQGDWLQVTVVLTDGDSVRLEKQVILPDKV